MNQLVIRENKRSYDTVYAAVIHNPLRLYCFARIRVHEKKNQHEPRHVTISQHTQRNMRRIAHLFMLENSNGKVKFITQCTENIFIREIYRQHREITELSLRYASVRIFLRTILLCVGVDSQVTERSISTTGNKNSYTNANC